MKIGFIYPSYAGETPPYGTHGQAVASELIARGHELWAPGLASGPGLVGVPASKWGKLSLLRHVDLLYIRPAFRQWMERCSMLRLLRPSLPVVWEINSPVEHQLEAGPDNPAIRLRVARDVRRMRRLARFVDVAFCVCQELADHTRDVLGIRRTIVTPNGGDPAAFDRLSPEPTALRGMIDKFTVLWAGGVGHAGHGLSYIVEAAQRCWQFDRQILFVLIGYGKPRTRLPHLPNLVVLKEMDTEDTRRFIRDADCCIAPYEPFTWSPLGYYVSSLKLFEYMAAGKPIVSNPVSQVPEILRDGVDALLIEQSGEALARAIVRLRTDATLRVRLGASARQRLVAQYTWRHTVDRIEPVLRELVEARHPDASLMATACGGTR